MSRYLGLSATKLTLAKFAAACKEVSGWFSSAWSVVVVIGASVGFIVAVLLAVKRVRRNQQRAEDLELPG